MNIGPIAVVDVETTGLFPHRHHRIIEIAVVVVSLDGKIWREFVSLVNPMRDIGPSSIHGLNSEDILAAPKFSEIASDIVSSMDGCVAIAGHNIRFDREFLESEFSRIGQVFPPCPQLCTMQLGHRGRLEDCCAEFGIPFEGPAHTALHDARAAAHLLVCLLATQPEFKRPLIDLSPIVWPRTTPSRRKPLTRNESRQAHSGPSSYLQVLLSRKQPPQSLRENEGTLLAYAALLDRALEDRHIDEAETEALIETADRWGMANADIERIHHEYLNQLAIAALADGVVTTTEKRDLDLVARLLGEDSEQMKKIICEAADKIAQTTTPQVQHNQSDSTLTGKSVCFTGQLGRMYRSAAISRTIAESLAREAGLVISNGVTKSLDLLVVADPCTQSGKARKARGYGIRILHEPVFWKLLDVNVD
jgi:DNA polymerase-3 subunit epsilon